MAVCGGPGKVVAEMRRLTPIVLALLIGCATTGNRAITDPAKVSAIMGATPARVVEILGEPTRIDGDVWVYEAVREWVRWERVLMLLMVGPLAAPIPGGEYREEHRLTVRFWNGRVISANP